MLSEGLQSWQMLVRLVLQSSTLQVTTCLNLIQLNLSMSMDHQLVLDCLLVDSTDFGYDCTSIWEVLEFFKVAEYYKE